MFTDERRGEVWGKIRQHDNRAFASELTPAVLVETAQRGGLCVVQSPLYVFNWAWLGIAAALHKTDSFACVLTTTLKLREDQQPFAQGAVGRAQRTGRRQKTRGRSKHDPRRHDPTAVTEEACATARQRMPLEFWFQLIIVCGEHVAAAHGERHQFRGFRILAMDGTRLDLPNWAALKKHFGSAQNKSGTHQTQARLVLLQFPFTRLPYRHELSPLKEGEVTRALRLVQHLPRATWCCWTRATGAINCCGPSRSAERTSRFACVKSCCFPRSNGWKKTAAIGGSVGRRRTVAATGGNGGCPSRSTCAWSSTTCRASRGRPW